MWKTGNNNNLSSYPLRRRLHEINANFELGLARILQYSFMLQPPDLDLECLTVNRSKPPPSHARPGPARLLCTFMDNLKCNRLTCRRALTEKAVVVSHTSLQMHARRVAESASRLHVRCS